MHGTHITWKKLLNDLKKRRRYWRGRAEMRLRPLDNSLWKRI
jgi:hypothetical protein